MNQRSFLLLVSALAVAGTVNAGTIYQETFANGTALSSDPLVNTSAIASYFLNQSGGNGEVLNNSTLDASTSPGQVSGAPGVTAGPAGYTNGYFLVEGTGTAATGTNNTFFASSNFAVTANTNYTVSFDLTNVNPQSPATINLQVNGVTLLAGVTALGDYGAGPAADNWQTFSVTWNSGSNTTANLALIDTNTNLQGNDFAVDVIQVATVAATPEPSTFVLLGGAGIVAGIVRRKRPTSSVA